MPRIFNLSDGAKIVGEPGALLQPKPKRSWNPFHYLWIGMEQVAYFFAPPNGCVYCWVWRMFFIGAGCGAVIAHWWWR